MQIRLENINKTYYENKKENKVLDNVSFVFNDNEINALIGGSGKGKTTILNIIAGLIPIDSGKIYFDDIDVTNLSPKERNIGYIFQNYALFSTLSVKDNILFPLCKKGFSKEQKLEKMNLIASKLGISSLLERKPHDLSGGEAQRVAIARAIIKSPKVLLMDEPFAALDQENKKEAKELIKQIQKDNNLTIIFVSHDKNDVDELATNIINL